MNYTVYGQQGCNYCVRARNLLRSKGRKHQYVDILDDKDAREFIVETEGHRQVPQIYVTNAVGITEYIGGHDDLVEHLKKTTH